jgi:hypothetical protein
MTVEISIAAKDKRPGWLTVDCRDDKEVDAVVVVPAHGPNHRAGLDCWCHPEMDGDMIIVHNEQN